MRDARWVSLAAALLTALLLATFAAAQDNGNAQGGAPPGGAPPGGAPQGGAPPPGPPLELQDAPDDQNFVAIAEGVSQGTVREGQPDLLNIELDFVFAPYGFRRLDVRKLLDARVPPPFPVTDGTYTFTALNGDTMVLATEGTATLPPSSPDKFFAGADEAWTVRSGTGRFEGATGEGKVLSAVAFDALGKNRSGVLKYFYGNVDLREG